MNKIVRFDLEKYLDNEPKQSSSYWINRDILEDILFQDYKLRFIKWIEYEKTMIVVPQNDSLLNLLILNHSTYIIKIENE
jgi:hypothetical protein